MKEAIKKIVLICVSMFCAVIIVACSSSDKNGDNSEYPAVTEPEFAGGNDWNEEFDCGIETDCTNIVAVTEFEQYSTDVERINCTVTNNNIGNGFYIYDIPFIERLQNDKWVRVDFWTDALMYENNWGFCYIKDNTTKPNSTRVVFLTEYLLEDFCPGEYRLVVFVGCGKVYAPFKVVE